MTGPPATARGRATNGRRTREPGRPAAGAVTEWGLGKYLVGTLAALVLILVVTLESLPARTAVAAAVTTAGHSILALTPRGRMR